MNVTGLLMRKFSTESEFRETQALINSQLHVMDGMNEKTSESSKRHQMSFTMGTIIKHQSPVSGSPSLSSIQKSAQKPQKGDGVVENISLFSHN